MMTCHSKPEIVGENKTEGWKIVYSEVIGEPYIWTDDTNTRQRQRWALTGHVPVYSTSELRHLKDATDEHKRFVHYAKTIFPGSKVINQCPVTTAQ